MNFLNESARTLEIVIKNVGRSQGYRLKLTDNNTSFASDGRITYRHEQFGSELLSVERQHDNLLQGLDFDIVILAFQLVLEV